MGRCNCKRRDGLGVGVKKLDLVGQSFGQLTVVGDSGKRTPSGIPLWDCICSCGNRHTAATSNLKYGSVLSCGCLRDVTNRLAPRKKKLEATCIIEKCDKPAREFERTLCRMHGKRLRVHGDVNYITPESIRVVRQRDSILKTMKAKPNTYKKFFGRHEHRVIGERMAGRPLRSDEHVHHKDENKHNNSPENLVVMTAKEHLTLHARRDRTNDRKRNAAA